MPAIRSVLIIVAATSLLAACSSSNASTNSSGLTVATTVAPITSIAANIGGDRVAVEGIVPEGTNSHTFEPAPQVAALLSDADVIFVNGLQLEEPTKELAQANMKDGAVLVDIGDEVIPESDWIYDFSFPEEDGKPNPHLWTDPLYAIKYAKVIADTFSSQDPANANYYQGNYVAFKKKATALSNALLSDQKTVPDGNLKLLTYHDAYAYFARDYGWDIIGAVQPKNFEDPTPQEVAALIDQVKAEHVPTIFGSEVFPSAVLEEIGRATGARYEDTLRDDDLPGEPGDAEHSWLGLMRYDYVTMVEGLGGTATKLSALDTSDVAPDQAEYPQ
ncbi:MAG TPA: metal ABC transporter substrate-binding protein [Actinomycetes bacterium]|nr:metal ABC transporter substrate-binding protein [Actinomycetes bacterium]